MGFLPPPDAEDRRTVHPGGQLVRILSKITERQAREILSAPPERRVEVAEWISERFRKTGEIPSTGEIRGFVQDLLEAEEFLS